MQTTNITDKNKIFSNEEALEKLVQENLKLFEENLKLTEKHAKLTAEIERLNQIVALFKVRHYSRRAEKFPGQQELVFDEAEVDNEQEIIEAEEELITVSYERPKKPRRKPLPKDLPREQIIHDLPEEEKVCGCGEALHKIGEQKSEQIEIIPAQLKVIEHIRPKYGCRACEEGVKTAPMPKLPIPKSIASPGTLAHVLVAKFCDHLPLYRLEQIFKRIGIDIPRKTSSQWVLRCGELLLPLVELLKKQILATDYIKMDETPTRTLQQDKAKKTNTGYMWVLHTGPPNETQGIVFEYNATRRSEVADGLLKNFKGYLQTDAYAGYNHVKNQSHVIDVGCMAHCRRRFFDIVKISKKPGAAHTAVNFIAKLYAIEKIAKQRKLSYPQIKQLRQEKAVPILLSFKAWLDKNQPRTLPKSALGQAIAYACNHWQALIAYLQDGRIEIDNNAAERTIKPFKIGYKNWLFHGNERGAKASAVIYSLIETCKANKVEPYAYLREVLTKIPYANTEEDLVALLPDKFIPEPKNT